MSILFTFVLLAAAHFLAARLKHAGALPSEQPATRHEILALTAPGPYADAAVRPPFHVKP